MGKREYVVWEEVAAWPWWASALVAVVVAGAVGAGALDVLRGLGGGGPVPLWRGLAVGGGMLLFAGVFWVGFGRLRVTVTRTSILLDFGYTGLVEKLIHLADVRGVEAVRYRPLREFGGWGIRSGGGGKRAWTIRGDGAVVLDLDDGTLFYVGSDHPQRLAERIRTAMGPADRGTGGDREAGT